MNIAPALDVEIAASPLVRYFLGEIIGALMFGSDQPNAELLGAAALNELEYRLSPEAFSEFFLVLPDIVRELENRIIRGEFEYTLPSSFLM